MTLLYIPSNLVHLVHVFLSHFKERFWIYKSPFSRWLWRCKLLRPWKNIKMKTKSLSCGTSLSQTIIWLIIFLSSWNLLNWPLSKSLTTLKMKRHYPCWHLWSCNFIIIWWGIWKLLYKCSHDFLFIKFFFPFQVTIIDWNDDDKVRVGINE